MAVLNEPRKMQLLRPHRSKRGGYVCPRCARKMRMHKTWTNAGRTLRIRRCRCGGEVLTSEHIVKVGVWVQKPRGRPRKLVADTLI